MKKGLLFFLIVAIGCHSSIPDKKPNGFKDFLNNIPRLNLPLTLYDSVALDYNTWGKGFDTNDVKKYHLLDGFAYSKFPFKSLTDYKCAPIGYFIHNNQPCLIYKTFTTEAGSGNPQVELVIFDITGNNIYGNTILIPYDVADPRYPYKGSYSNYTILSDPDHFTTFSLGATWVNDSSSIISTLVKTITVCTITKSDSIKVMSQKDTTVFENKTIPTH